MNPNPGLSFWEEIKILYNTPGFLLVTFGCGCNMAYFGGISTQIDQIISVYGYSSQSASAMGSLYQFFGIFGGLLCSWYLSNRFLDPVTTDYQGIDLVLKNVPPY